MIRKLILHSGVSFLSLSLLVTINSCKISNSANSDMAWKGTTMGTSYSIRIRPSATPPDVNQEKAQGLVQKELNRIDSVFSTWKKDSQINKINTAKRGEVVEVPAELIRLIEKSRELNRFTGGAFDPTMGPLIDLWGFGTSMRTTPPSDLEIKLTKESTGLGKLEYINDHNVKVIDPAVRLNMSAIAKGYAVDRVFELLREQGFQDVLVEVGGEIRASTSAKYPQGWKIGIERPEYDMERELYGALKIKDGAVATSGDYRNFFKYNGKRYSHIIDPETGYPVKGNVVSATVTGKDCMTADALATSLLVMDADRGINMIEKLDGYETLLLIMVDDQLYEKMTPGMAAYLTR